MGLQDRDYARDDTSNEFRLETMSVVMRLIVVTVGVFLIDLLFGQGKFLIQHEVLACNQETLLHPWMWWQLLTSGFAHADPTHLAFNMIGLYFFGRELEYQLGKREMLTFYLFAIVFSSIVSGINHAVWSPNDKFTLLGASGGVMAVIIAFCCRNPMAPIIRFPFTLNAWMLGVLYVASDVGGYFFPALRFTDKNIGYDAHLGGAAWALMHWFFSWQISSLFDNSWISNLKRRFRRINSPLQLYRPADERSYQQTDQEDAILAKVHEQGIGSLTAKEKNILEAYSRRLRERGE